MAAPAVTAAAKPPAKLTWMGALAYIDAMPGVPSWAQIEEEIDASLRAEIEAEPWERTVISGEVGLRSRMVPPNIYNRWAQRLLARYPAVYSVLRTAYDFPDTIVTSTRIWYVINLLPVADWVTHLIHGWHEPDEAHMAIAMRRLSGAQARQLIDAIAAQPPHMHTRYASLYDRYTTALRAYVEKKKTRTYLAQARLVDHLSMRDRDAAQYLARWVAPDTITHHRPLAVHPVAPPRAMTNREYLASILDVVRAPGQDPAGALARARLMLETLMANIAASSQ